MKHFIASPLTLALAACALASTAQAAQRLTAPPEFLSAQAGALAGNVSWQAVDDDVLAHQTGKAPGAEMVSGLVLDLVSQWQMPNGASATAHGKLTVTTGADNSLSAQVSASAQANDGLNHGNGNQYGTAHGTGSTSSSAAAQASAMGGQNVSVNGVSQITQVAGNGNTSMNSAVIDFDGSGASNLTAGGAAGAHNPNASAASVSGNVTATVTFGNGGVALSLQTPAGIARQTIAPTGAQGGGAIAQLVQVAGNAQAVVNQLQLHIQTQPTSGALLRQLGVLQAMQNAALGRR